MICKAHFTKSLISSLTAITKSKILAIFAQNIKITQSYYSIKGKP
mgnify:CR=1 FL=1